MNYATQVTSALTAKANAYVRIMQSVVLSTAAVLVFLDI